jgi:hypothetical protein
MELSQTNKDLITTCFLLLNELEVSAVKLRKSLEDDGYIPLLSTYDSVWENIPLRDAIKVTGALTLSREENICG